MEGIPGSSLVLLRRAGHVSLFHALDGMVHGPTLGFSDAVGPAKVSLQDFAARVRALPEKKSQY